MKLFLLLGMLFLFFSFVFANDVNNTDANILDANVLDLNILDVNIFTGLITLHIKFEHQIIGNGDDYNAKGWCFGESKDYYFEEDLPSQIDYLFFDWEHSEIKTYVEGNPIPSAWLPMVETDEGFSFSVNLFSGEANLYLFLLSVNEDGDMEINHLDADKPVTVKVDGMQKFYLLGDIDDYGNSSFSLDIGIYEIGVAAVFRERLSEWDYIKRVAYSCADNPMHRCLIIPSTGEEWDFDACLDKDSELNKEVDGAPDEKICVGGKAAHNEWYVGKLIEQNRLKDDKIADITETGDPALEERIGVLEGVVNDLANIVKGMSDVFGWRMEYLWGGVIVFGLALVGIKVYGEVNYPDSPIIYSLKEKLEEVKKNVRQKAKGEGFGGAGSAGGSGARGAGGEAERLAEIRGWW